MRVLHVIPSISPLNGGPSFALHALVRSLAVLGIDVDVATTDDHGSAHLAVPSGSPVRWEGVNYHFFHRKLRPYTFAPGIFPWLAANTAKYDLVHIHSLFSFTSTTAGWVARLTGTPYVVQPHGSLGVWGIKQRRPAFKQLSLRLAELPILRHAATVYLNTEREVEEMHAVGIRASSDVINYAIDFPVIDRARFASLFHDYYADLSNNKLILFLSRLHPKKGLDMLLPAFKSVLAAVPDAVLLLVGDGDPAYVAQLRKLAEELGISNSVRFMGFLSGDLKWGAFAAAKVFVLPSYSENFGIAPIEAMATGTPVVVSDQAAVCKEVEKCSGGIVVPCNTEAFAKAIGTLLSNPDQPDQWGENAKTVIHRFSAIEVARETARLYERILHSVKETTPVNIPSR